MTAALSTVSFSAQRSDPTLSRTGSETLSSPPAVDCHPTSAGINQDGVGIYDEELVGEPSQQGDAIVIPEYAGVFSSEFQLDLIEGHMEGRADSSRIVGSTRSVVRRCAERHPRKIKQRKEVAINICFLTLFCLYIYSIFLHI